MVGHLHVVSGLGWAPRSSRGQRHRRWMVSEPGQRNAWQAAPWCLSARLL